MSMAKIVKLETRDKTIHTNRLEQINKLLSEDDVNEVLVIVTRKNKETPTAEDYYYQSTTDNNFKNLFLVEWAKTVIMDGG